MDDPRPYQITLFDIARDRDIIVVLPTGAGKTRIATLFINYRIETLLSSCERKYIFFLTPRKALVGQQAEYIRRHLMHDHLIVREYTGATFSKLGLHIDHWSEAEWNSERSSDVCVMTPEILRRALYEGCIKVEHIDTIVSDECHHMTGNDVLVKIFNYVNKMSSDKKRPRILGLTATTKKTKKGTVEAAAENLSKLMKCHVVSQYYESYLSMIKSTQCNIIFCKFPGLLIDEIDADESLPKMSGRLMNMKIENRLFRYHAFKRIHLTYDLISLKSILRHSDRIRPEFCDRIMSLSRSIFNAGGLFTQKDDNVGHEDLDDIYNIYYNLRAIDTVCVENGSIVALYGIKIAFDGCILRLCDVIGDDVYYVRSRVPSRYDEDVIVDQIKRLEKSFFRLNSLSPVQHVIMVSLVEFFVCVLATLPVDLLDKAIAHIESEVYPGRILFNDESSVIDSMSLEMFCLQAAKQPSSFNVPWGSNMKVDIEKRMNPNIFNQMNIKRLVMRIGRLSGYIISLFSSFRLKSELEIDFSASLCVELNDASKFVPVPNCESISSFQTIIFTDKTKYLIKLLDRNPFESSADSVDISPRAFNQVIVFCKFRLATLALNEMINNVFEGEIVSPYCYALIGSDTLARQNLILKEFRAKQAKVLITTNVSEEGIDVQQCNLVINIDPPESQKSFVQRRGRARANGSNFLTFIPNSGPGLKTLHTLREFQREEIQLNKATVSYSQSTQQIVPNSLVYSVSSTGAMVDESEAISHLHLVCSKLFSNEETNWRPTIQSYRQDDEYRCTITLPAAAPQDIREVSVTTPNSKSIAQNSAAIKCIENLHRQGLINDNLDVTKISQTNVNSQIKEPRVPPETITIKTVQDLLTCDGLDLSIAKGVELHFYFVDCKLPPNAHCEMCRTSLLPVNDIGFMFLRPLNVSNSIINCGNFDLAYAGARKVFSEEWSLIARFHRAVHCWINNLSSQSIVSVHDVLEPLKETIDFDALEWSRPADGAWYAVFPRPSFDLFAFKSSWMEYLIRCVNECEVLAHNLWVQEKLQRSGSFTFDVSPTNREAFNQSIEIMDTDMILSKGRGRLFTPTKYSIAGPKTSVYGVNISSRLTLYVLFDESDKAVFASRCLHCKSSKEYPINDQEYSVLGRRKWLDMGLCVPMLIWHIQTRLLTNEASRFVSSIIDSKNELYSGKSHLLDLSTMHAVLTPRRTSTCTLFEVYEFLGDSFLKFISSLDLYRSFPKEREGQLTDRRSSIVRNRNLARKSREKELLQYLRALPLSNGNESLNVMPPGLCHDDLSVWNTHVVTKDTLATTEELSSRPIDVNGKQISLPPTNCDLQYHRVNNVNAKEPADLVEAIIGGYFYCFGTETTKRLVRALRLCPESLGPDCVTSTPPTAKSDIDYDASITTSNLLAAKKASSSEVAIKTIEMSVDVRSSLNDSNSHVFSTPGNFNQIHSTSVRGSETMLEHFQRRIGYYFKDRSLLRQACILPEMNWIDNNQRLEFLGDAVLDFAFVRQIIDNTELSEWSEGILTERKCTALGNYRLSLASIYLGCDRLICECVYKDKLLYNKLKQLQNELTRIAINDIVDASEHAKQLKKIFLSDNSLVKTLADCFEAIVGAIFLDSGESFEPISQIIRLTAIDQK